MVNKRRWRYIPPEKRLAATLKAADLATRDAQAPTGTEREQAVRKLQEQQALILETIESIPVAVASDAVGGGFTPSTSWQSVASVTVGRPAGKASAAVMALASVVVNWTVSGANAWPVLSARVVVNGNAGPPVPLGQGVSAAATSVSGRMSGAAMRAASVAGAADISVSVQVAITGWIGDGAQGAVSWSGGAPQVAANVVFSK